MLSKVSQFTTEKAAVTLNIKHCTQTAEDSTFNWQKLPDGKHCKREQPDLI